MDRSRYGNAGYLPPLTSTTPWNISPFELSILQIWWLMNKFDLNLHLWNSYNWLTLAVSSLHFLTSSLTPFLSASVGSLRLRRVQTVLHRDPRNQRTANPRSAALCFLFILTGTGDTHWVQRTFILKCQIWKIVSTYFEVFFVAVVFLLLFLFFKEDILISGSSYFILDSSKAARHNWPNSNISRSSENSDLRPLSFLYFLHSLRTVCISILLPLFLLHACLLTPLYTQPLYWHKRNTAKTLIKCYLQLTLLTL